MWKFCFFYRFTPINLFLIKRLCCWKIIFVFGLFFGANNLWAQVDIDAEALVNPGSKTISVKQKISYFNKSQDTLQYFYLNDWNNAFKSKTSPLGKHFSATYLRRFQFSDQDERGETKIDFIKSAQGIPLNWKRADDKPDIIKITLSQPLLPGETLDLELNYTLRIAEEWLTGYGVNNYGEFNLNSWLINPAVYDKDWHIYSHKNLDDQYSPLSNIKIKLKVPPEFSVYSGMKQKHLNSESFYKEYQLSGENYNNFKLAITQVDTFDLFKINSVDLLTNIENENLPTVIREVIAERILSFLNDRLGKYPHQQIFVSEADYKSSPIYGLNQLPDFIRPFSNYFQYDLKMLKTITRNYVTSSMQIDRRKEEWILNALEIYLMMEYVEEYYPEEKLLGDLSDFFGIRWSHLADLDFNDHYQYFFMNMNRLNLDQPLSQSKDSLVKFNQEIANPYKAGVGFKYLQDFLDAETLDFSIKEFYQTNQLKPARADDFERILKNHTKKNVDWFFKEYVNTNVRLDFKIKKVKEIGDSLMVTVKNIENNSMPVSLYGIDEENKKVVYKIWVENTKGETTVKIPKEDITRLGLNYEGVIPEINQRNNYKNLRSPFKKPLQFRLFTDAEDPHYSQVFLMPEFSYNYYDGLILGSRFSNQAILPKRFTYNITPEYGSRSGNLVGSISLLYNQQFRNKNLHKIAYGFSGNRFNYAPDAFYHRMSPYVRFSWRHRDLRNKERQSLTFRNVLVNREDSPYIDFVDKPNYSVFNLRYIYSNRSLIENYSSYVDFQLGRKFSKVSFMAKYRKLFLNNQQLEFRLFAGGFLSNKTDPGSDYFSFGLDRPTDYMFDYNYYGRSESSGFFSQQYIENEGGFKSKLDPHFANQWMVTLNSAVSLYRDIFYVYGDVGAIKNKNEALRIRYDSGVRLSLIQDYFEVFFPVYSNNGWEMRGSNYDKKIRFIVTLDLQTLMGLFTRTYY